MRSWGASSDAASCSANLRWGAVLEGPGEAPLLLLPTSHTSQAEAALDGRAPLWASAVFFLRFLLGLPKTPFIQRLVDQGPTKGPESLQNLAFVFLT